MPLIQLVLSSEGIAHITYLCWQTNLTLSIYSELVKFQPEERLITETGLKAILGKALVKLSSFLVV